MYSIVEAFWCGEVRIPLRRTDCRSFELDLNSMRGRLVLVWSTFGESSALHAVLLWDSDNFRPFDTRQETSHTVLSPFFLL